MKKFLEDAGKSLPFQLAFSCCSFLMIIALLFITLQSFIASDKKPTILYEVPKKPIHSLGTKSKVEMGLIITNFSKFDTFNNDFIMSAIIWFIFNPSEVSLTTIENFSFEQGTITYRSPSITKLIDDKLFVQYDIQLKFSSHLSYTYFPLNDHMLYISMQNKFTTPDDIVYHFSSPTSFSINKLMSIPGWKVEESTVESGHISYVLDSDYPETTVAYPEVVFSIKLRKEGISKLVSILIPLLLIFYLALFTLSLHPVRDRMSMLGTSLAIVTALLAYRFVIQNMSPPVTYFTFADYLFIFILITTFFCFCINFYGVWRETIPPWYYTLRAIVSVGAHFLIVTWLFLFLFAMKG